MAEDRRDQIKANAQEAIKAVRKNRAGTVEDLKKDLVKTLQAKQFTAFGPTTQTMVGR